MIDTEVQFQVMILFNVVFEYNNKEGCHKKKNSNLNLNLMLEISETYNDKQGSKQNSNHKSKYKFGF